MGKRYFCDYCQRTFLDDITSRQKHLNGVSHLRQKKEYYALNRDLKTLIKEEREKESCRRYRNTGECPFGLVCNHTHYSPEELASFEVIVAQQEETRLKLPSVDDWLANRKGKSIDRIPNALQIEGSLYSYDYALPPSMRPPTIEEINFSDFSQWG